MPEHNRGMLWASTPCLPTCRSFWCVLAALGIVVVPAGRAKAEGEIAGERIIETAGQSCASGTAEALPDRARTPVYLGWLTLEAVAEVCRQAQPVSTDIGQRTVQGVRPEENSVAALKIDRAPHRVGGHRNASIYDSLSRMLPKATKVRTGEERQRSPC